MKHEHWNAKTATAAGRKDAWAMPYQTLQFTTARMATNAWHDRIDRKYWLTFYEAGFNEVRQKRMAFYKGNPLATIIKFERQAIAIQARVDDMRERRKTDAALQSLIDRTTRTLEYRPNPQEEMPHRGIVVFTL